MSEIIRSQLSRDFEAYKLCSTEKRSAQKAYEAAMAEMLRAAIKVEDQLDVRSITAVEKQMVEEWEKEDRRISALVTARGKVHYADPSIAKLTEEIELARCKNHAAHREMMRIRKLITELKSAGFNVEKDS